MQPDSIASPYTLTSQDETNLANAMKTAYQSAQHASYMRAAKSADVSSMWQPSTSDNLQAEVMAMEDAARIKKTYEDDLHRAIGMFLAMWYYLHHSYDGVAKDLAAMLTQWCDARADWKAEQITRTTIGRGLSGGTAAFVNDLLDGRISDASGMGTDGLFVAVVPAVSSSDLCEEYAGYMWPIDEYPGLGKFPAHINCIHSEIVLRR